ncbi:metallophosphoesterase [Nocardia sp. NBC_01730]|uniref:metallophosphoesterase n=1 Tax=Nocardia sp. NBC_01730 TaxID=2975998 RepID=UPI002E164A51|nr:metallophosphoesterase [Nocardia sp. NBC_01730]
MVVVIVLVGIVVLALCLVVLALFGALHWYVWRRLVRDTTTAGSRGRRVGTAVVVAGPLLLVGSAVAELASAPLPFVRIIAWPGYLWGALFVYLLFALFVGEPVRLVLLRFGEKSVTVPVAAVASADSASELNALPDTAVRSQLAATADRMPRRVFVSRIVGGAAVAAAATTVGSGTYSVLDGPSVKHVAVPLAKLPRRADGFRITVVSDIHLGPILGRGFAERVVHTVNDTQPDLIAIVGDLVDGSVEHLRSAVEPLADLHARHGAFFVTGNHEYFSGAEQWIDHVQELGMHLLANARTELPGFDLAGVNDLQGERTGHGPDFGKALGDRDRSRTAVLLAHQPVLIDDAVAHGVDLQLSGHTHGGQIWPGNYLAGLVNPTVAGLERYGDTQLYVTRGAGAWGPPVRVGAPSDITVVELVSRQA